MGAARASAWIQLGLALVAFFGLLLPLPFARLDGLGVVLTFRQLVELERPQEIWFGFPAVAAAIGLWALRESATPRVGRPILRSIMVLGFVGLAAYVNRDAPPTSAHLARYTLDACVLSGVLGGVVQVVAARRTRRGHALPRAKVVPPRA